MSYKMDTSQLKIAEKLVILNDRAVGMLTRMYNIKKNSQDPKSKPSFMSDKAMESAIKYVVRKFPIVDTRNNSSTFSYANTMKEDIVKNLSLYYYTFVDLLDLKENIIQFLSCMDSAQCQLDICFNFELTSGFLNLVVNFICLMILLSRVEDRKQILGLYNAAYDLWHGQSEASFPRLGQMILDYENPLKKLSEDLGPLSRLISTALSSISPVYVRRNLTADMWRRAELLSMTVKPLEIRYAAQTDTVACEYLSLDGMDRWIIFCCTVCHSSLLNDSVISHLWLSALQMGLALRIFRDEVFIVHQSIQQYFDSIKGYHKKSQDVKESYSIALQQCAQIHADRRRFLRNALRELVLFMKDSPGLLGPKILFVLMGLSFSRDEVLWLLRHIDIWPSTNKKGAKQSDELADKLISELIFYMVELRDLVTKYTEVIQRYYLQFVQGHDAIFISEELSRLNHVSLTEDESKILDSFVSDISHINSGTDLRALRLDWFRFQASTSVARAAFSLQNHKQFTVLMNTTVFHLKMIDLQEELLRETSDLSIYCFYIRHLERQWRFCISMPAQCRFVLAFARVCSHFQSALHDMCPEEKKHVSDKSLALCTAIIEDLCGAIDDVANQMCENELRLCDQTSTSQVASQIVYQVQHDKGGKHAPPTKEFKLAGEESHRVDRHNLTMPDKLQTMIVEMCVAISSIHTINVSDYIFNPKEYLAQHLENKFVDMILNLAMLNDGSSPPNPRRPSQLLMAIQCYMNVLQNIDTCVTVDITRLFNKALLEQSQPLDSRNRETLTSIYTKWYLEVVLRRAATGQMVWSEHLQAMISGTADNNFAPEQYTDPHELRCLAQIIGPYGVKYMSERLIWHVASQIGELNKIVQIHKEPLHMARVRFDNVEKMKEVVALLAHEPKENKKNQVISSAADAILQRTSIIGQIFSFRDAVHCALRHVLAERLPFLIASFRNLYDGMGDDGKAALGELGAAMGQQCIIDAALANAVRAQNSNLNPDEHYNLSCLLMVAIAISLPRLALNENSIYKPSIQAAINNTHCIPVAVNTMVGALFYLHGKEENEAHKRMKEFLALASSSILRVSSEIDHKMEEHNKHQKIDEQSRNQHFLYIILDQIVKKSPYLTGDVLEACFPYNLIRTAYLHSYHQEQVYMQT